MTPLLARLVPGLRRWHRRWVEPNPRFVDGRWTPEEDRRLTFTIAPDAEDYARKLARVEEQLKRGWRP